MGVTLNRRTFLASTALAGAAVSGALGVPSPASAADQYDALRASWLTSLTGGSDIDTADPDFAAALDKLDADADTALSQQDSDGGFGDLPLGSSSAHVTGSYTRIRSMALAYATAGTSHHGDSGLLDAILAGLAAVHDGAYNATQTMYGNWWDWQIGSPKRLNDIAVLVYDKLPADQLAATIAAVDHFVPDPTKMAPGGVDQTSTGANRVDECTVVAIRGILGRSSAKIAAARDALSPVFAYVTSGDGFYRDGSFVQHTHVAYTGTYGLVLLSGMGALMSLLAGSNWEVTDPNRQILFDAVDKTYAPMVFDDQMMDNVRGRAVSRSGETDHDDGHQTVLDILALAPSVDPDTAAGWRSACAGWLDRDSYDDPLVGMSVAHIALVKQLRASGVKPAPEPVGHNLFAQMDRAVHRRPGWAYAIAMSSERIAHYEHGNGENLHGWHQGSGMGYLYTRADDGQFCDAFWPTVDPYRLPGTTVDSAPLADAAGGAWGAAVGDNSYAGGAVVDDTYAVVGQELTGLLSSMRANKSWFCLDNGIVALGAGISGGSGGVETVVENRNLHTDGSNPLLLNGIRQPDQLGWSAEHGQVRWAHLEGVAGYVFLGDPVALSAAREERTGRWRDINTGGSTGALTRRYLTMWLSHGSRPDDARYAYLLLPTASAARTAWTATDPGIHIVANDRATQAIRVPRLGLVGANLFTAGTLSGPGVPTTTVDAPASILLRRRGRDLTVVVADPTHHSDQISVRMRAPGFSPWRAGEGVSVSSHSPMLTFTVDTSAHDGAGHQVTFRH